MYKYKLNNSYTVYVNWSYYSECAKICKVNIPAAESRQSGR